MINDKLMKLMLRMVKEYSPKAKESIIRNTHMNDYKSGSFPEDSVEKLLEVFTIPDNYSDLPDTPNKEQLLNMLVEIAKKNLDQIKYDEVPQNAIDAILVDFINYVATFQGVDYGLYTTDLYRDKRNEIQY